MSALGQKQTCALQNGMSALPPKVDIRAYGWNVRNRGYCEGRHIYLPLNASGASFLE